MMKGGYNVLGNTLATSRGTRLDLTRTEGDNQVSDDGVFRLTRSMGDHHTPAVTLRKLGTASHPETISTSSLSIQ